MCGHRYTQFGCKLLEEKTLIEKCLLCVTGNDNEPGPTGCTCGAFAPEQWFPGLVWP